MRKFVLILVVIITMLSCDKKENKSELVMNVEKPFVWEGANLYFLLTDRFNNADKSNDINFDRTVETAKLRGFQGGDIKGITQKINDGYFTNLGVNAIWLSPVVEQIHKETDEGTGVTYGYHGYWTKDWTALDPNFGTMEDLSELVETAHKNGIRIVLDAVINHIGPVTTEDEVWPEKWVRTGPPCKYDSYETAVTCTLVENLPDIKTESNEEVLLPPQLIAKWKSEGRYEQEIAELDAFFERTGYPRAPRFYIIKWLTDYIREFGIDGYRSDTVRHIEESVWDEFKKECELAFSTWKENNLERVLDDNNFYMVGEVYDYDIISSGRSFDFGDKKVDYYAHGFNSMINFEFKKNATSDYESLFSQYSNNLQNDLKGVGVLNYFTSHDDSTPFDKERTKNYEAAIKLLLTPGTSQIYYGDETSRSLIIEGTTGDATLRSFMNWTDIEENEDVKQGLVHWQKLGQFRNDHPAIGAGIHKMISQEPYTFQRTFLKGDYSDTVVVGLDLTKGTKEINVSSVFIDGSLLVDAYSDTEVVVNKGVVKLDTPYDIVLLEIK
ncbi:MAG: alpha-amylase family glycosyl hydrolase [Aureibaculum sp.]|nr:alpha-amylase family glycosyl hydrolase [Aureibaculum sp.]